MRLRSRNCQSGAYGRDKHPRTCSRCELWHENSCTSVVPLTRAEWIGRCQRIDVGPAFQSSLKTLEGLPLVVETRGLGLMAGIELVDHTNGDSEDTDMEVS